MPQSAAPSTIPQSSPSKSQPTLLTLPPELRHKIYNYAFAHLSLSPFHHSPSIGSDCYACHALIQKSATFDLKGHLRSHNFSIVFAALLTCKQLHTEALPIFYSTLTLAISDTITLSRIRKTSPPSLRARIHRLTLTVHLSDDNRLQWYRDLTCLAPDTFPHLTHLTIHNHMRPPISYDNLTDAIYLSAPIVGSFPTHLQSPPALDLILQYRREEIMFESPLLGEITTRDSIDAHESVIRDLMADSEFRAEARAGMGVWATEEGVRERVGGADFDVLTGRLLVVARGHEERWLEGLQRRRFGGMTVREVQERVARERMAGDGGGAGNGGGEGEDDDSSDSERDENGWSSEDWEAYRQRIQAEEEERERNGRAGVDEG